MAPATFAGRMRPEVKYGLIGGTGICLWITLEYLLGFHTTRPEIGTYTGLLSNLIPLAMIFLLLRRKRAAVYDGRLSLAASIGAGLFASFVASLLVYSFLVTYSHSINPTWIDQALDVKVAAWRAQQVAETTIQERITLYRNAYTPFGLVIGVVLEKTLLGGVLAVALAPFVRSLPHRPD